ncbi:MAG: guanylate kinase [Microscillaceae bacterium]|nr:guanylate kinase [Microscillaceae bacterium]MDW8460081.1 guanylate kinase [Cytophagales bacterium]
MNSEENYQPKVIIFSAPSGAGKTSIVNRLLELEPRLAFSVSATTRPKRLHETEGKDYYFLDKEQFEAKIKKGEFIEWEEVYTNVFYGTLKSEVQRLHEAHKVAVFDLDVKGGLNIKKHYQNNALAIFVQPPSLAELEQRLRQRRTETEESLQKRLAKATYELGFASQFDHTIINYELDQAVKEAYQLVVKFLNS